MNRLLTGDNPNSNPENIAPPVVDPPTPPTEPAAKEKTGLSFPLTESKKVFIRRKSTKSFPKGSNGKDSLERIGSSLDRKDSLRGLLPSEEDKLLPRIIGIRKDSDKYESAVKGYWDNISAIVPAGEGLELEVGMRWDNEADYIYDRDKAPKKDFYGTIVAIELKGTPIDPADYILWRYCLVYGEVANTIELVGKSPKIRFYIYSKEREIKDKKLQMRSRQLANALFLNNMGDRQWVDSTLRVLVTSDDQRKISIHDINKMDNDEKDIALEEYVTKQPEKVLEIGKDADLVIKAFIENCISAGVLNRVPNTQTIMRDTDIIGNSIKEAVGYLKRPENERLYKELEAGMRLNPLARK